MNDPDLILDYYQRTSCSVQWMEFSRALGAELSLGLPADEIRRLFYRIGERLARAMPVERCNTLDELQNAFNARWSAIDWGFSELQETDEHLRITHACSPLAMAFGPEATEWAAGFFEGAYQDWFATQGIPTSLRVQTDAARDGAGAAPLPQVHLRLGRVAG
jgi:hypothetical protein